MNSITNDKSIEKRPFKKNLSEALPTPARLKRTVLRRETNEGDKVHGKRRSSRERREYSRSRVPRPRKHGSVWCRYGQKGQGEDPCSDERRNREPTAQ